MSVTEQRRQHHNLREIFEEAYEIALPYLDPAQGYFGIPIERQAYVVLHERYPQFSVQEIDILMPALKRVFKLRQAGN
jgi:hypothetical protein